MTLKLQNKTYLITNEETGINYDVIFLLQHHSPKWKALLCKATNNDVLKEGRFYKSDLETAEQFLADYLTAKK